VESSTKAASVLDNFLNFEFSSLSFKLTFICHGGLTISTRFGSAGGLSQPRRDTVDPIES